MQPHTFMTRSLRDSALAPRTLHIYNTNLQSFLSFTRRTLQQLLDPMHPNQIDTRLSVYLQHLHDCGRPFQSAAQTIGGLVHHCPRLRLLLVESRLRLRGWARLRTSTSHPPLTWELTVIIASTLSRSGHHAQALACLLAFDCYLRVGEMTSLRACDVIMPNDPRMGSAFTSMALRLPKTKTGLNQWGVGRESAGG